MMLFYVILVVHSMLFLTLITRFLFLMLSADALPTGPVFHKRWSIMLYKTHISAIGNTYAVKKNDSWKKYAKHYYKEKRYLATLLLRTTY